MAIELIRQARERLEQLKVGATEEWVLFTNYDFEDPEHIIGYSVHTGHDIQGNMPKSTAELIVTLRRTVDAQIQILKQAEDTSFGTSRGLVFDSGAVALAKAIMGVE